MVVCNTKPKNYSSLKVWKFNGCLLQTQVHCTTFSFQVFFLFFTTCAFSWHTDWLRYMWWLKLNKKFFEALLQCIHVNFFIFFESVNLTHSVESTESKVLEITNLVLKTYMYIIAIMQIWSLLIIIISLNFAYFYATKMSTNLAKPNLTLIAITRWEILESLVKLTILFQKYPRFWSETSFILYKESMAWIGSTDYGHPMKA